MPHAGHPCYTRQVVRQGTPNGVPPFLSPLGRSGRSRRQIPGQERSLRCCELVHIIRRTAAEEEVTALSERVQGWISGDGGEVQKVTPWGRRRLAYPIERFRDGSYVQVQFKAQPNALGGLERQLKLSE